MHTTAQKLNILADELNTMFLEREDFTRALLLALLSRNNIAAVGAPGTSKSLQTRTLVEAITGATYFEQALSKTRPAEAVFGPIDIKALREDGDYKMKRKGFITDAHIAFLDEGFKMSPVLGHDLLPVLNERVYHEVDGNGNTVHSIPLSTTVIASNEFPTDENDDAAALWDRVMLRVVVDYLQNSDNFSALLTAEMKAPVTTVQWDEIAAAIDHEVPAIDLPAKVIEEIVGLRQQLRRENIEPSDRRWRQSVSILKANAFLAGRSEVALSDIEVLRHVLWDTPQQMEKVERLCKAASNPYYEPVLKLRDMLNELSAAMDERMDSSDAEKASYGQEMFRKLKTAREQLLTLEMSNDGAPVPEGDKLMKEIDDIGIRGMMELLNQDDESIARASLQNLWSVKK